MSTDPLLDEIEMALDLYGLSATAFGSAAAGDLGLVRKLRDGRRIKKPMLRRKIQQALATLMEKGSLE